MKERRAVLKLVYSDSLDVVMLTRYGIIFFFFFFHWLNLLRNRNIVVTEALALTATQGLHPRDIDSFSQLLILYPPVYSCNIATP